MPALLPLAYLPFPLNHDPRCIVIAGMTNLTDSSDSATPDFTGMTEQII
jgi:hypothetical protein